jgi:hypothetical protein
MHKRQNNLLVFFWRLFHIFISLICALIFATTDGNMTCSKCFQNCNPFLNLELSSLLKKYLIPLTIRLPTSKGSSITPLIPTSLGSKGDGNTRHWKFGNKSGLRDLLCCHLQHLINNKQRDTRRFCYLTLAYSSYCHIVYNSEDIS